MDSLIKIDYNMTADDIKWSNERVDLVEKIKRLDKELGKEKRKAIKNRDVLKIEDLQKQIKYHIFAFNKITEKLYGSEVI